jgi:hypothetical protein
MNDLDYTVNEVLAWLKKHPHRDYLDAAFAVVVGPSGTDQRRSRAASSFSTSQWPVLISAVKEAVQKQAKES